MNKPRVSDRGVLPIFLISFNRGEVLKQSIAFFERQNREVQILVNDFGSDDPDTLEILDDLEAQGVQVFRREKIKTPDDLNSVDDVVQEFITKTNHKGRYGVSDCDIWFDQSSPDSLDVYERLLDCLPSVDCVGPMLRISDIPHDYPLYAHVMNRHIAQFWRHKPLWLNVHQKRIPCLPCLIDTTFAIHREGSHFRRLKEGLRVYQPYDATHIDWYLRGNEFWDSQYSKSSNADIAHWNNEKFQESKRDTDLIYDSFFDVSWDATTGETIKRSLR